MKRCWLALGLMVLPLATMAQETASEEVVAPAVALEVQVGKALYKGDSIPHVILPTLSKYPPLKFANERERQRYNRLVANVKKVLPIAKLAKHTIIETYDYLETLPTKEERDAHIRQVELGLRRQYTPLMKKLSYSQGKLLVKLVDRECTNGWCGWSKAGSSERRQVRQPCPGVTAPFPFHPPLVFSASASRFTPAEVLFAPSPPVRPGTRCAHFFGPTVQRYSLLGITARTVHSTRGEEITFCRYCRDGGIVRPLHPVNKGKKNIPCT